MSDKTVYLVLENGKVFSGHAFGAEAEAVGEIAITTSMVGYLETLTDPAYFGQIVVQTFPSIGNYGVMPSDLESEAPVLKAYIVREWCQEPSNFRCEGDLDTFLKDNGIIGLYGIDTRELTRTVRANGASMNAKITENADDIEAIKAELAAYKVIHAVETVTTKEAKVFAAEGETVARVAAIDFGTKREFVRALTARGCEVTLLPADTTAAAVLQGGYDGAFLTSGPGNPADNTAAVNEVKVLLENGMPLFGLGLGHQLLALAHGAKTEVMPYGHRGGSLPSVQAASERIHNTPQNHGYTVVESSLPANAVVTYKNINDGDVEGIAYEGEKALSVQFYPCRDTVAVYDQFVAMMKGGDEVCR